MAKSKNKIFDFMDLSEEEKELVDDEHDWEEHWVGMPEFDQKDNPAYKVLIMRFRNKEDYEEFSKKNELGLTEKTKSAWYPKLHIDDNALKRWIEEN